MNGYLLFKKPDGTYSSIELLRPKNWLETEKIILREVSETTASDEVLKNAIRQKSSDGKDCNIEVYIDLPEMGTVGWATLISIKENIEIKGGSGNVVTGRFRHVANNVIDLQVEGVEKIGCTDNHPIWSVDREDFIEAGKLVEGERVLLYNGETRRVVQKLPRPGPQCVNNLEVFGEHVYHVTLDGVFAHNMCAMKKSNHANKRHAEGRPVGTAYKDIMNASDTKVYIQDDGRFFVVGSNKRAHVITAEGELVTSMDNVTKSNVKYRKTNYRMELATPEQIENLKSVLRNPE